MLPYTILKNHTGVNPINPNWIRYQNSPQGNHKKDDTPMEHINIPEKRIIIRSPKQWTGGMLSLPKQISQMELS